MSYNDSFGDEYALVLRHASSAGGYNTIDEDWVVLSWYGEYHELR